MKTFFNMERQVLFLLSVLLVSVQILFYFLLREGMTGILLSGFLLLLIVIALLTGPVVGLFGSLLFIFIVGSLLIYWALPSVTTSFDAIIIPLPHLLGYGVVLIILVLIAGHIHDRIIDQGRITRKLQNEFRQFVAVDVETGFDNEYRMAIEIEAEMKRIDRYNGEFTLFLLQIDHLAEFQQLYGEKEKVHLLTTLSQTMRETMRLTDRKFRYAADRFALLLTQTDDLSVEVIYAKLAENMTTHRLRNGKYVTLSFRSGHGVYDKDATVREYRALFSQVESEMVTREL